MLIQVHSYAFSTTFRLKDVSLFLEKTELPAQADINIKKDHLIVQFKNSDSKKLIFIFDFGAITFVGIEKQECEKHVQSIVNHYAEPHPPLTEDFLVEINPELPLDVKFDRVISPSSTIDFFELVSLLLAQSAAIDYYEEDVREILQRTQTITSSLQTSAKLPGRINDLLKFIGSCIATKNGIITTLSLFDKPESTWENDELNRLYEALRIELEINDRFRALEAKLRMIQENLILLVDIARSRSSWKLEFTVILLIALEIIIMVWQTFHH